MGNIRVMIPEKLQSMVLKGLHHQGHPGRMKATARSYLWWPGLDKDLEKLAKSCLSCQTVKQIHLLLHFIFGRIHIDFAGSFLGKMYFLVVDVHSKWAEVFEWPKLLVQGLLMSYVSYFLNMVSQNNFYPTMDHNSSQLSLENSC